MRPIRLLVITLLGVALVLGIACSSTSKQGSTPVAPTVTTSATYTPAPTTVTEFTEYTDNSYGFSISIPDDWNIDQANANEWIIFACPQQCGSLHAGSAVIVNDTEYSNVQDYYTEQANSMFRIGGGLTLISKEDLTLDGRPAVKMIYTAPYDNETNMDNMECMFIYQQAVWTIIMQCDSTCRDIYEPTFDTMLSSFQVPD